MSSPAGRVLAGTVVAAVAVSSFAFNGTGAGAATTPNSQSVGRFLDGSLGTSPVQTLADIKDARAVNPGTTSAQNPLDVNLLNALDLPLTGALQLPQLLGIKLGAVNQVAVAHSDGYSYGASGAVSNSGGVSVGGNNKDFPANATIDLTASGIAGNAAAGVDALGGIKLELGAVSALASTPAGVDKGSSTAYQIAGLKIEAGSPLLGSVLGTVSSTLGTLVGTLTSSLGKAGVLPPDCTLLSGKLPTIPLENGALVLDASTGTITFDLAKLLSVLKLNLNTLAPNTDLIKLLVNYIVSPTGLAAALTDAVNGLLNPLEDQFNACSSALTTLLGPVGTIVKSLLGALTSGQKTLETTISGIVKALAGGLGVNPLAPVADVLTKLVDIGVNVQPNGAKGTYTDKLKATPAQGTPVVAGQTVVRAIEVNLLGNAVNLALANAAAGPSNPQAPPTTTPPTTAPPTTAIPTGVPAGLGTKGGTPALPLILLLVGLLAAGGGVTAQRLRGRRSH